jgi:LuxR family transcriptional regulator, quorum-sensing system regulator BjaR1
MAVTVLNAGYSPSGWSIENKYMSGERGDFVREAFTFVDGLERLSSVEGVCAAMAKKLAGFGIENFIVTGIPAREQSFENLVIAARWPDEFFTLYVENDYARFDPIIRRCVHSHSPFAWRAESYVSNMDSRVAEVMRRAADFGLRRGYTVPIHGPDAYVACVSMAGAECDLPARERPAIHLMALYAFERMRNLRGRHPDEKQPLTIREREVLAWAADGKSALDIGQILNISKRTVDEHSQTAARKLGASNRTQAVAIALRDRIIDV